MYQIGDYLVHENSGVCKIVDIDDMELMGRGSKKTYYCMSPVFKEGAMVFTPVDGGNARLRSVASADAFHDILDNLDDLDVIEAPNDRVRQELFKEVLREFSPEAMSRVVKTALVRKWDRIASGKKVMAQDEKVLNGAGKKLFEEMAFSLDCEVDEVQNIFEEKIKAIVDNTFAQVG